MSFTYDVEEPIGWIRLMIGDTTENEGVRPTGENYKDEEIQVFLNTYEGNAEAAFLELLMVLSTEFSSAASSQRFADFQAEFKNKARELEVKYRFWKDKFTLDASTGPGSGIYAIPYSGPLRNVPTV